MNNEGVSSVRICTLAAINDAHTVHYRMIRKRLPTDAWEQALVFLAVFSLILGLGTIWYYMATTQGMCVIII